MKTFRLAQQCFYTHRTQRVVFRPAMLHWRHPFVAMIVPYNPMVPMTKIKFRSREEALMHFGTLAGQEVVSCSWTTRRL